MRARQLWQWIYAKGARDFAGHEQSRARLPGAAGRGVPRSGGPRWWRGRSRSTARASTCCGMRRRGRGRGGLHPRGGPGDAVRVVPGGLHAGLLVLPYRHPAAGAQPDRGRDRWADPGRARRSRRLGAGAGREAADLEPRADGHGRAALQLRGSARRDADRDGRRGDRAVAAADHALDLGRGAGDPAGGGRDRDAAGDLVPCDDRRGAGQAGADQPQVADRGAARRRAGPIPGCRTRSESPSST